MSISLFLISFLFLFGSSLSKNCSLLTSCSSCTDNPSSCYWCKASQTCSNSMTSCTFPISDVDFCCSSQPSQGICLADQDCTWCNGLCTDFAVNCNANANVSSATPIWVIIISVISSILFCAAIFGLVLFCACRKRTPHGTVIYQQVITPAQYGTSTTPMPPSYPPPPQSNLVYNQSAPLLQHQQQQQF